MDKGSYCLILEAPRASRIRIGALGDIDFPAGWYVYCGSAHGPGGLTRVLRHIRVSRSGTASRRWHIDYLLCSPSMKLVFSACSAGGDREAECSIARTLRGTPVEGFGCSDCRCRSHLLSYEHNPVEDILTTFSTLDLVATIKRINTS